MKAAIWCLALALVATNGFWTYVTLDNGVSKTYREETYANAQQALQQTIAIGLKCARGCDRVAVREAAAGRGGDTPVDLGKVTTVGQLRLQFDEDDHLVEINQINKVD